MCLFSWGGQKSLLDIYPKYQLQRASGVFKLLPSWLCWGEYWMLFYFTVLIFSSIFLSPIAELSVWGKKGTEMALLWKEQLKLLHILSSSAFWIGFSCSLASGIWVWKTCSWVVGCPKWGLWSAGTRSTSVETSCPSLWAVTLLRNWEWQTVTSLWWWLNSEQILGHVKWERMGECYYILIY